jgi:hypothetical protein
MPHQDGSRTEAEWAEVDAEHAYWRAFCPACGVSPCEWDGQPDGFHTDDGPEPERQPIDPALFARTAPAWNCISDPDGPHYTPGSGRCEWCGKDQATIAAEYAAREQEPCFCGVAKIDHQSSEYHRYNHVWTARS